jgi:hypothetical protein
MRFTKEYFEKHKPITNEIKLDELVDVNGSSIEGDFNPGFKDIQTGPVPKSYNDNSDYVKGVATTTDKMATYVQPRSWWVLYSGYGGTPYSSGYRAIHEVGVAETLVDKKESKDIVDKSKDLDLEEKLKKIEDLVKKSDLSTKDKEKMINIINDSKK